MARKRRIILIKDKKIAEVLVSKPPAPRNLRVWLDACTTHARAHAGHFATRMGGQWAAYALGGREPVRTFPTEDAAAMWLLHRSAR